MGDLGLSFEETMDGPSPVFSVRERIRQRSFENRKRTRIREILMSMFLAVSYISITNDNTILTPQITLVSALSIIHKSNREDHLKFNESRIEGAEAGLILHTPSGLHQHVIAIDACDDDSYGPSSDDENGTCELATFDDFKERNKAFMKKREESKLKNLKRTKDFEFLDVASEQGEAEDRYEHSMRVSEKLYGEGVEDEEHGECDEYGNVINNRIKDPFRENLADDTLGLPDENDSRSSRSFNGHAFPSSQDDDSFENSSRNSNFRNSNGRNSRDSDSRHEKENSKRDPRNGKSEKTEESRTTDGKKDSKTALNTDEKTQSSSSSFDLLATFMNYLGIGESKQKELETQQDGWLKWFTDNKKEVAKVARLYHHDNFVPAIETVLKSKSPEDHNNLVKDAVLGFMHSITGSRLFSNKLPDVVKMGYYKHEKEIEKLIDDVVVKGDLCAANLSKEQKKELVQDIFSKIEKKVDVLLDDNINGIVNEVADQTESQLPDLAKGWFDKMVKQEAKHKAVEKSHQAVHKLIDAYIERKIEGAVCNANGIWR